VTLRSMLRTARFVGATLIAVLATVPAHAQPDPLAPPFAAAHTIATSTTAVPVEHDLDIANAGQYQVTLTDLGAQLVPAAPLAAVKLAVTSGTDLVGTQLSGPGVLQFTASAPGKYVLHVVGMPGTQAGSGPIGIDVGTAAAPGLLYSFSDTLALPGAALPNGEAVLNDSFALAAASGTYTVALNDFTLPDALSVATLILIEAGGIQPLAILPDPITHATQANVTLQTGVNYRIVAASLPGASGAGLMGATVTAGNGSVIYGRTAPVGTTLLVGDPALGAGVANVKLTDLGYPAAFSQLAGVVVRSGKSVATLSSGTTQAFNAAPDTYQVYVAAIAPAAAPAAGSFAVLVQPATGAAALNVARLVTAAGASAQAYSFDAQISAAGAYVTHLTNFAFPVSLTGLRLAVAQNGALLGTPLTAAGNLNITGAAGPITLLVLAQADPTQGGVFDVNLTASGNATLLFDATQGVVGTTLSFLSSTVAVDASGKYVLTLGDVGFPANFANIAALVSQGGTTIGTVFGADALNFAAAPGNYAVSLIAQPANADEAGTFSLSMALAPPPTVTLTASAGSVASGGTVTLTWATQEATACTASGGWTGSQPVNGSVPSAALSATTVFTLTCDGAGGSQAQSVTVTVDAPGGGGGAVDIGLLLLAGGLLVRRTRAKRTN
jgi:hypothetical protein